LRHIADDAPYLRLLVQEIVSRDRRRPRCRREQRCQHLDGRAFAGAIGANQAKDLAALHIQRESVDSGKVAEATRETIQRNQYTHRRQ